MVTKEHKKYIKDKWYDDHKIARRKRAIELYRLNKEEVLKRQKKNLEDLKKYPEKYRTYREKNNLRGRIRYQLNREKESLRKKKAYYERKKEPIKYLYYKEIERQRAKSHYAKNKKKHFFEFRIVHKYGMTEKQYYDLLWKQEYRCAICQKTFCPTKKQIHIDHDHRTGKVRGLLCCGCNTTLGHFEDDLNKINKFVNYLIEHGKSY